MRRIHPKWLDRAWWERLNRPPLPRYASIVKEAAKTPMKRFDHRYGDYR